MASKRKRGKQQRAGRSPGQPEAEREDLALADELLRVSREEQADFVAGWDKFMQQVSIRCKPIGAKKLRERLIAKGFAPESNEFSQDIIAMREE